MGATKKSRPTKDSTRVQCTASLLSAATVLTASLLLLQVAYAAPASAELFDFEAFPAGHVLTTGDFGANITLNVTNNNPADPDAAIVFNSSCPGGCSGGDNDLQTPGSGPGNTVAQGMVMIIAENTTDTLDCPDQSACGGGILSLVMVYDGSENGVTIRVSTKKHTGSGDLGVFAGLNPGDAYEVKKADDDKSGGPKTIGSAIKIEVFSAGGTLLELDNLHTSCSQPIYSGMAVGTRQHLVCFDSKDILTDDDCGITGTSVTCEDGSAAQPSDGLVDDPDDEAIGGAIQLAFASPRRVISLRAIDIDATETGSRVEIALTGGGTQVVPFVALGNNSAQTVTVPSPQPADALTIFLTGSGGIDDILLGGACGNGVIDSGEDCDDGNQTDGDCCSSSCAFETAGSSCTDDGNVCTDNVCDGSGQCNAVANTQPCDDGLFCTVGDVCSGASCNGAPRDCSDSVPCTADSCDEAGQSCTNAPQDAACSDGLFCNGTETCDAALGCQTGTAPCNDGISCTTDSCDEATQSCTNTPQDTDCDDGLFCNGAEVCDATNDCQPGVPPLNCDDAVACTVDGCDEATQSCKNTPADSLCSNGVFCDGAETCDATLGCQAAAPACNDGVSCTADSCDETTQSCTNLPQDTVCSDGLFCNGAEVCDVTLGCQAATPACDDGVSCTADGCDEATQSCTHTSQDAACDDGLFCNGTETCDATNDCQAGVPPLNCDDGVGCTVDSCDEATQSCMSLASDALCDDGSFCNGTEMCDPTSDCQPGTPVDCSVLDSVCGVWVCDESAAACTVTSMNEGGACDDGDVCTPVDICVVGTCDGSGTLCGDNSVDTTCGEECDPPNTPTCDSTCKRIFICGDGILDPPEECDDGNTITGDGCDNCILEGEICFEGSAPAISRGAKYVTFSSAADFVGDNPDGNTEVFILSRKLFQKLIKKGTPESDARLAAMQQITDTQAPVNNEGPSLNSSARFVAFVSNGDLTGENPDGNREVFLLDLRRGKLTQVSKSTGVDNLRPNLRARKTTLLVFDSPANLVPALCAGGVNDLDQCTSDAECPGAACGNTDGNREIFEWLRRASPATGKKLRQLTAAPIGDSIVGRSVNFFTRATALSSDADLVGQNPDRNREIFRVIKKADNLVQITQVDTLTSGPATSSSPAQSRRNIIVFASDADLVPGENTDHNKEIFLWRAKANPPYLQATNTQGCVNDKPTVNSSGQFVAFESTCDLIPSKGNPDQSVFIFDTGRLGFLRQLVLRGPSNTISGAPTISSRNRVVTYEASDSPREICIFNVKKGLFEGPVMP